MGISASLPYHMPMAKLFFMGDSITAGAWDDRGGWVSRVAAEVMTLTIKADFQSGGFYCLPYNLGVSGDTTADILHRLKSEIMPRLDADTPDEKVQLVFSVGVNDSTFLIHENRLRLTDDEFQENIASLVALSKTVTDNISFIGLLPVDQEKVDPVPWAMDSAYRNDRIKRLEDLIGSVCLDSGVAFLPLFDRWHRMDGYKHLLIDGIHPNPHGHALLANHVQEFLITESFLEFHREP